MPLSPSPLEALCASRLGDGFFVRVVRWYGWGIAVSYGIGLAFTAGDPTPLLWRALGTLAWLVGGVYGLAAARDPRESDGLLALAEARGFSKHELERARFGAALRRTARATIGPALALTLVPWFRVQSSAELVGCLARTLAVALFALALSVTVAGLARLSAALSPGRGRATLLGLVLLPHAARSLWPSLPSVPSLLAALLDSAIAAGGA